MRVLIRILLVFGGHVNGKNFGDFIRAGRKIQKRKNLYKRRKMRYNKLLFMNIKRKNTANLRSDLI